MGESCGIVFLRPSQCFFKGASIAALIAHRPDKDGRTVAVAQNHGRYPIQRSFQKCGVIRNSLVCKSHALGVIILVAIQGRSSVALVICFINHVQSQLVAELIKIRHVRVVAGADRIKIVLLDHLEILQHLLKTHSRAGNRVRFVPVHAAKFDGAAIEQYNPIPDTNRSESYALYDGLIFRFE